MFSPRRIPAAHLIIASLFLAGMLLCAGAQAQRLRRKNPPP